MALSFCPFCGAGVGDGFRFCPACGRGLEAVGEACRLAQATVEAAEAAVMGEAGDAGVPSPVKSIGKRRKPSPKLPLPKLPSPGAGGKPVFVPIGKQKPPRPAAQDAEPASSPVKNTMAFPEDAAVDGERSPLSGPSRARPAKRPGERASGGCTARPLDGEELMDTTGRRWVLGEALGESRSPTLYLAHKLSDQSPTQEQAAEEFLVKIGPKDGCIYKELNFYQRVARPDIVAKWVKLMACEEPGILKIEGFGLHKGQDRFLVFSRPGRCLHAELLEAGNRLPPQSAFSIARGILGALEYLHAKEYAHANLHAASIYRHPEHAHTVLLADFSAVARFCPDGRHVSYQREQRQPHLGPLALTSVDAHHGAVPSRRGDVEMLGYSLLSWLSGTLPWATATNPDTVMAAKITYKESVAALIRDALPGVPVAVSTAMRLYLEHVFALPYDGVPDYNALRHTLNPLATVAAVTTATAPATSPATSPTAVIPERKTRSRAARRN